MTRILVALISLWLAHPAWAETSPLQAMMTGNDSKGWEGVGRLNIGGEVMCTGSLISETLVLTAAHCLFKPGTGERYADSTIEFLAGWRGGRASAYRSVRRSLVNPKYDFHGADTTRRVSHDIAILELDQPIRKSSVTPFEIGERPRKGAEVGVVSYAKDRAERPSIQETCKVLARQRGALVLNCDVDRGSSGSPVFVLEAGEVRIVSVVSAKAHAGDLPVSLATGLQDAIDGMLAEIATTDGMFTHVQAKPLPQVVKREGGATGSAKFVRPGG